MNTPFFSIIIPTFNRASFLRKAIQSVIQQTYADWELIIVDDGSTDNTKEVVESLNDPRIIYIYQHNQERSAARNKGINTAAGEYICFLDSDDYYTPERLTELDQFIDDSELKIAFFYTGICFNKNRKITQRAELKNDSENNLDFVAQAIIGTPQACIHRSILTKHQFNVDLTIGEDMELWIRVVNEYPLLFIDQYTVIANDHDDRSVNIIKYNSSIKLLKTLKVIFNKNHPGNSINKKIKKETVSYTFFGIARYYEENKKIFYMLAYLTVSIIYEPFSPSVKKKIYMIYNYIKTFGWLIKKVEQQKIYKYYNIGFFTKSFTLDIFQNTPSTWFNKTKTDRFIADPFAYTSKNEKYIFVEEYEFDTKRGHISIMLEDNQNNFGQPIPIIKEDFHLSYPFLLNYKNELFIIPESNQNNELTAYKCIQFPFKWEKYKTVKKGPIVDANLLFKNGKWWLFYSKEIDYNYSNTHLFLEYADSPFGPWKAHPQNPIKSDISNARNGGAFFQHNGKTIRPAQNCKKHYGHKLVLNEIIELNEHRYQEKEITIVEAFHDSEFPEGIHHISVNDSFVVFDGMKFIDEIYTH